MGAISPTIKIIGSAAATRGKIPFPVSVSNFKEELKTALFPKVFSRAPKKCGVSPVYSLSFVGGHEEAAIKIGFANFNLAFNFPARMILRARSMIT